MALLAPNLTRLVGTIDVQGLERLRREACEMGQLGYYGVYFNHIFFTMEKSDFTCAPDNILFREDNFLIVRRPDAQLRQVRKILEDEGLKIPSSHFLNMLPEPGMPVELIFAVHERILDTAKMVRECAPLFLETHFHDNFGINDNHNPVGIGTINWFEVIGAMNEVGYEGEITFEQSDYVTNHRNWMLLAERVEKNAC